MSQLVSVIIPTYGGNISLKRAIDSVLEQDYPSLEIVVVDDNDPQTNARRCTEKIMDVFSAVSYTHLYYPSVAGRPKS